ncbi:hypothetical protein [Mycobacterium riyadhense]|uniref:hypothetical protein n=1 Tax=Mycobacterium riyadhense TaxID=486698 RepID=UPI00194E617E|nr:hypothetical protein [Mycobacterium riyadhense]
MTPKPTTPHADEILGPYWESSITPESLSNWSLKLADAAAELGFIAGDGQVKAIQLLGYGQGALAEASSAAWVKFFAEVTEIGAQFAAASTIVAGCAEVLGTMLVSMAGVVEWAEAAIAAFEAARVELELVGQNVDEMIRAVIAEAHTQVVGFSTGATGAITELFAGVPGMGAPPSGPPGIHTPTGVSLPGGAPADPAGMAPPAETPAVPSGLALPGGAPAGPTGLAPHGDVTAVPTGLTSPGGAPSVPTGLSAPGGAPAVPTGLASPTGAPAGPTGLASPGGAPAVPAGLASPGGAPTVPAGTGVAPGTGLPGTGTPAAGAPAMTTPAGLATPATTGTPAATGTGAMQPAAGLAPATAIAGVDAEATAAAPVAAVPGAVGSAAGAAPAAAAAASPIAGAPMSAAPIAAAATAMPAAVSPAAAIPSVTPVPSTAPAMAPPPMAAVPAQPGPGLHATASTLAAPSSGAPPSAAVPSSGPGPHPPTGQQSSHTSDDADHVVHDAGRMTASPLITPDDAAISPAPFVVRVPGEQVRVVDLDLATVRGVLEAAGGGSGVRSAAGMVVTGGRRQVVVTTDRGRSWFPPNTLLPEDVVLPWAHEDSARWEGLLDPARAIVEYAAATSAELTALASTHSSAPGVAAGVPFVFADAVERPRPDLLDGPVARREVFAVSATRLAAAAAITDPADQRRQAVWIAHDAVVKAGSPATRSTLRRSILAAFNADPALSESRKIERLEWDALVTENEVLWEKDFAARMDVRNVAIGQLDTGGGKCRPFLVQSYATEAVLALRNASPRQALLDALYSWSMLLELIDTDREAVLA